jgi:hypothetical protein
MDRVKRLKVRTWNFVVVLILGIFVLVYVLIQNWPHGVDFYIHLNERRKIVDLIKGGQLKIGKDGIANLPEEYRELALFGTVGVVEENSEMDVFFQLSKTKDDFESFVYCSGDGALIFRNKGLDKVLLPHKLIEHWFYVDSLESKSAKAN